MQILWRDGLLMDALSELNGERIFIATAYLTADGVAQVRALAKHNDLNRDQTSIFLGTTFATACPGRLLRDLQLIARVYIVDKAKLHAKVFLVEASPSTVILGSANLTEAGLSTNLEFGLRFVPSADVLAETQAFFDDCLGKALRVNEEVIQAYEQLPVLPTNRERGDERWDALHHSLTAIRKSQESAVASVSSEPLVSPIGQRTSAEALRTCLDYLNTRGLPKRREYDDITFRAKGMAQNQRAVTVRQRKPRLDIYLPERPLPTRFTVSYESSFHVRVPIEEWDDPEVMELIDEAFRK